MIPQWKQAPNHTIPGPGEHDSLDQKKERVCQSRRKNTAEMSKSESTIEEEHYLQTCAVSPSTLIASSIEIEDIKQLHQLSQAIGSQPSQESFSICSILSQLKESLKDLQTRMVRIETYLAIVREGMEKMQATRDEIKVVTSQKGLTQMAGSETGEFARFCPGFNPSPMLQNNRQSKSNLAPQT